VGAPKKSERKNTSALLSIRITEAMRDTIEQHAARDGLGIADEVRMLITEAVDARSGRKPARRPAYSDPARALAPVLQQFMAASHAAQTAAQAIIDQAQGPATVPVPTIPAPKPEPVK
jgi:hypothetical protein